MISNRPYIIRAMYEWMVDNGWTPHVQVDALYPGIQIPQQFVQEGVIVFNIAPAAVVGLDMDNDSFAFKARFQGVEQVVRFPPEAVLAIFARENGQGMPFPREPYPTEDKPAKAGLSAVKDAEPDKAEKAEAPAKPAKKGGKKPTLSVVK
ncbi:ClpXP protease specificity-enhancing factor [Thiomicrorhabdus cannonii]|uniref:ClpXP protease specificity-enhancing factor n=1 Tax=Thiomicrorhabdus cannonii TaxID=2748011 RepID=UPI0015BA6865|nr:ClpXP protease specificity-enhancing factor [Thiomicrorhabdus cannonii]